MKPYIIELDQVGQFELLSHTPRSLRHILLTARFGCASDDGAAIQDALEEITNQRSVPNIFIDHKHIGGNSELQRKKSQLPQLLKEANAI